MPVELPPLKGLLEDTPPEPLGIWPPRGLLKLLPGMMVIVDAPRVPSWLLTLLLSPWVSEIRPVTAAQPMSMPMRLRAKRNFLDLTPSQAESIISRRIKEFHFVKREGAS